MLLLALTVHTWAYWAQQPSGVDFEPAPPAASAQLGIAAVGLALLLTALIASILSRRKALVVVSIVILAANLLLFVTLETPYFSCLLSTSQCVSPSSG